MTTGVIDDLEIIKIQKAQCMCLTIATRCFKRFADFALKVATVDQSGQGIMIRMVGSCLSFPDRCRNIAANATITKKLPIVTFHRNATETQNPCLSTHRPAKFKVTEWLMVVQRLQMQVKMSCVVDVTRVINQLFGRTANKILTWDTQYVDQLIRHNSEHQLLIDLPKEISRSTGVMTIALQVQTQVSQHNI